MITSQENLMVPENREIKKNTEDENTNFSTSWLSVQSASQRYLIPLSESGPVIPQTSIIKIPHAKPWFSGVINISGRIYGVVDLLEFLASCQPYIKGKSPNYFYDTKPSFIGFHHASGLNTVLGVEKVLGIQHANALKKAPALSSVSAPFLGECYTDSEGKAWQEIKLMQLAHSRAFQSIEL